MTREPQRHRRAVLAAVQRNNRQTQDEIAAEAGVRSQQVSKILLAIRSDGSIKAEKAILDPDRFGLADLFFLQVKLKDDSGPTADLVRLIATYPNVQEFHRTNRLNYGNHGKSTVYDLLVKLRCASNREFAKFLEAIHRLEPEAELLTIPVTESYKETTDIDLPE